MTKMIEVTCGVILTIARPDGTVERVENARFPFGEIPAATYRAMVKATKDAGRGDILSQEPMRKLMADIEPSARDLAEQSAYNARRLVERTSATGRA
jgi:hypothetical protein